MTVHLFHRTRRVRHAYRAPSAETPGADRQILSASGTLVAAESF
jgi:hypothetical protein